MSSSPRNNNNNNDADPEQAIGVPDPKQAEMMDESDVTNHEGDDHGAAAEEEKLVLARKEDQAVGYLRWIVVLLLATAALAVCLSVYFVAKRSEQQDFEDDFADTSGKVVESFGSTLNHRFEILENYAIDMTSRASRDPDMEWPFVSLPDFAVRTGKTAKIGIFLDITVLPIVQTEQLDQWNNFSTTNTQWLTESLAWMEGVPVDQVKPQPIGPLSTFNGTMFNPIVAEEMPGPYAPIWQMSPPIRSPSYNADLTRGTFGNSVKAVMNTGQPIFTMSFDAYEVEELRRQNIANLVNAVGEEYQNDAFAPIFYPVFDSLSDDTAQKKPVVALIRAGIYWRTYFEGILPASNRGIIVVLESTCGNLYTYQIDGSKADCLGRGDLHNPKYDYMEASVKVETLLHLEEKQVNNTTSQEEGRCHYGLRVYPSQELEDAYMTNAPVMFALTLAALFVVTCVTFLLYDFCVQRRQRIVMKSAQQSGKLVHSLFPEPVRERLYEEQEAREQAVKAAAPKNDWNQTSQLSKQGPGGMDSIDNINLSFGDTKASANAHLYPDCTVLFADIAGFTNWSSSRSPENVFELLESIYGAFDRIAKRRRVFKIETIGDCYVATTGLPVAQKDHAVRMCKFAHESMKKLHELIHGDLMHRLGEDTSNLAMRFGLHSGPVTGGVLRGEKARFQIFGDTVNTAARMESNGLRGRIQVSQATADVLVEAGRESWLVKREELVACKGKGNMQTYFVNISRQQGSVATMSTGNSSLGSLDLGGQDPLEGSDQNLAENSNRSLPTTGESFGEGGIDV